MKKFIIKKNTKKTVPKGVKAIFHSRASVDEKKIIEKNAKKIFSQYKKVFINLSK
jgi:hypothetical protein